MYDIKDERGVPVSSGIPPIVIWAVSIGILVIFSILGMVIFGSPFHHIWPSIDTTHIRLGSLWLPGASAALRLEGIV